MLAHGKAAIVQNAYINDLILQTHQLHNKNRRSIGALKPQYQSGITRHSNRKAKQASLTKKAKKWGKKEQNPHSSRPLQRQLMPFVAAYSNTSSLYTSSVML
jgi:hypothetical protein